MFFTSGPCYQKVISTIFLPIIQQKEPELRKIFCVREYYVDFLDCHDKMEPGDEIGFLGKEETSQRMCRLQCKELSTVYNRHHRNHR